MNKKNCKKIKSLLEYIMLFLLNIFGFPPYRGNDYMTCSTELLKEGSSANEKSSNQKKLSVDDVIKIMNSYDDSNYKSMFAENMGRLLSETKDKSAKDTITNGYK